jgi:putative FmdB family regulatory protein
MPTYEYACKSCGQHLEVVQSFKDDALTTCPACGGNLRKVFGNIGISFKGTGFYKNDSRSSSHSGVSSSSSDGGSGAASGSSGDSGSSGSDAPVKEASSTKETPAPAKEAAKDSGGTGRTAPAKPAAAAS